MLRETVARVLTKHLQGEHDQLAHGHRGPHQEAFFWRGQDFEAKRRPLATPMTPAQRQAVQAFEQEVFANDYESGFGVLPNGHVVVNKRGSAAEVAYDHWDIAQLKDSGRTVMCHNHPPYETIATNEQRAWIDYAELAAQDDVGFSGTDWLFYAETNPLEARVVGRGYVYRLIRPAHVPRWPSVDEMVEIYNRAAGPVWDAYQAQVRLGLMTGEEMMREVRHEQNAAVAEALGFTYIREEHHYA